MLNSKNVNRFCFGRGSLGELPAILKSATAGGPVLYFVDHFFRGKPLLQKLAARVEDRVVFVDPTHEPTVEAIDAVMSSLTKPYEAVVGIGGGCTLDTAKAVSNLMRNPGPAETYQGYDLLKVPGVYKIGIPTISGTGAEASRTCVLTNKKRMIKLGMNSDFTIFDQVILDPDLTATVPREQYFYTAMDTYLHCVEALRGSARHALADAYSHSAVELCREVFFADDMMSDASREKLMVASYFGGVAIANSNTGIVHPLSYGLSIVYEAHHCIANCLVMDTLSEFYPEEVRDFREFMARQRIALPKGICNGASAETFRELHALAMKGERPLGNAIGPNFRDVLCLERTTALYQAM